MLKFRCFTRTTIFDSYFYFPTVTVKPGRCLEFPLLAVKQAIRTLPRLHYGASGLFIPFIAINVMAHNYPRETLKKIATNTTLFNPLLTKITNDESGNCLRLHLDMPGRATPFPPKQSACRQRGKFFSVGIFSNPLINNYWMRLSMLAIIIKAKVCVIC